MFILSLLVLSIIFMQNITNLLLDVLDPFNKFGCFISLDMSMGGSSYVNVMGKATSIGANGPNPKHT